MPLLPLVVIIAFLVGVIFPFIYGAHWAFYLYELVYFLNIETRWWGGYLPSLPYSKISVIILIIIFMIKYKDYQKNQFTNIPQFKWILLLFSTFAITYFYALVPSKHEYALTLYLKMFITIGIAYKILDSQYKLEWALLTYLIGCFYIGYEAHSVGRNSGGRVEGIGLLDAPDANGVAAAIAPAFPLLIFYFWQGNKKIKVFIFFAGVFIVNALILINSRGAFLGAAAGSIYFLKEMYSSSFKVRHQKKLVIAFILMGMLGLFMLADDSFFDRLNTLTEVQDEAKSGSHRYRMWLSTFDLLRDYPFGTGVAGYNLLSPIYVEHHLFGKGQTQKSVHSIWFQVLSEIGWHGFIVFLMLIISTLKIANLTKKTCKENKNVYQYYLSHALLSAFISFLVAASFINQFRVQMLYWLILFITCFYSIIVLHSPSPPNKKKSKSRIL